MHTRDGGEESAADGRDGALAPVIPLFGGGASPSPGPEWDRTWAEPPVFTETTIVGDAGDAVTEAETALVRKLRSRQLSSVEARAALRERDLDAAAIESIVARFESLGYLDDARLAEQLAHAAVTRKGQGRRAIALALTTRGIPRAVADAALAELPDDDHERALEFARSKVRRGSTTDRDAALRRLAGQLSRRGYPSSVAFSAAREALDEQS